jgi:hypothetical protein
MPEQVSYWCSQNMVSSRISLHRMLIVVRRHECFFCDIPLFGWRTAVYRIVFVNHVDGFAFDGELDVNSTTTTVSLQVCTVLFLWQVFAIITVLWLLLLLLVAFLVLELNTLSTYIFKSSAVATVLALCRLLCVLEPVGVLYCLDDGSASRE